MRFLKKIDRLLVVSFIPPFILAFCIAIFVLVMQFLWSFIDDIVGKGVDTLILFEMIFYRSLSLFPLALPIGVLLAAVMVFGNLSERYELSSMKSAGISLVRIMAPVIVLSTLVGLFSFYCSNTLIPLSNLKFQSRLYDIRNTKPALSLEEGIFNDDFKGFTIRIGKKATDNRRISDILIYDESGSSRRNFHLITAQEGEMYVDEELNAFVFRLYNGVQYQEPEGQRSSKNLPFIRTRFREWEKYFDLGEFELEQTPEKYFKSHHTMKSVPQLVSQIDTIREQYNTTLEGNQYAFYNIIRIDARPVKDLPESGQDTSEQIPIDLKSGREPEGSNVPEILARLDTLPGDSSVAHFFNLLGPADLRASLTRGIPAARRAMDQSVRVSKSLQVLGKSLTSHIFELHLKFSLAVICIVFLFIGAPMGAIVRKGGFGYPLLIAISFFTIFIILNLTFKKLAENNAVDPAIAAWVPVIVLTPVSIYLSYKAMNDSKMLDVDKYLKPILKYFKRDAAKSA